MPTPLSLRGAIVLVIIASIAGCQDFAPSQQKEVVHTLRDAATLSQQSRDYNGAIGYYRSLYERDSSDLEAALGIIRNLRFLGQHEQAEGLAQDVLSRNPEAQPIIAELGKSQLAAGRVAAAIKTLEQAVRMSPIDWRAHSALGVAHDMVGDHAAAQSSYREALDISNGQVAPLNNLALSKALAGDLQGAIEQLEEATLTPNASVQIKQNLALLYALNGNAERARTLIRGSLPTEVVENNLNYFSIIGAPKSTTP